MSLTAEEKELKRITDEYKKAIQAFKKKEYQQVSQLMNTVIENYKDSEYYSVLEIQSMAKKYKNIAERMLNPQRIKLTNDEDLLDEGMITLNEGNVDRTLEVLTRMENEKKSNDPYLFYLLSIAYLKMDETEKSLDYLKKCVNKDQYYKVMAYNEPDFESLLENEDFLSIVE